LIVDAQCESFAQPQAMLENRANFLPHDNLRTTVALLLVSSAISPCPQKKPKWQNEPPN
jgi:hypothetical protein